MSWLIFPMMALAFSRAPQHLCRLDSECVLVRHTFCGNLESIARGQDELFAAWEKKERKESEAEHRVCGEDSHQDPRGFEAYCDAKGICEMRPNPPAKPELPPPAAKSSRGKATK